MPQGRNDSFEGRIADGRVPVPNADQTAALGDAFDLVIAQVAFVIAGASHAGNHAQGEAFECLLLATSRLWLG